MEVLAKGFRYENRHYSSLSAIEARKRAISEVVVTVPGTYLGPRGDRLLVRLPGSDAGTQTPLSAIRHITLIETAGSTSGDLMVEAAVRGISIHYLGRAGNHPKWPPAAALFRVSWELARIASSAG